MAVDISKDSISAALAAKRERLYGRLRELSPHQANCGLDVGPDRHRTLTSWPEPSANWDFTSISAVQLV